MDWEQACLTIFVKKMTFLDKYYLVLEKYSEKKDKKFQRMRRVELIGLYKIMNHYLEKQNTDVKVECWI